MLDLFSYHSANCQSLGALEEIQVVSKAQLAASHAHTEQIKVQYESDKHSRCHRTFKVGPYEGQKDINPQRAEGTCQWVLSHTQYKQWDTASQDDLLWISADPGCGKSVLSRSLVDRELQGMPSRSTCYFFFKDNDQQDNLATALCALLHQLFTQRSHLIQYAVPTWDKTGGQLVKDVSEMWRILLTAARDRETHDITCILDALDECRPSDRQTLINMLARFHTEASSFPTQAGKGRLKFLVTSRPYDDIEADFRKVLQSLPTIRLRGEDENDQIHLEIDLVIRMRVGKLAEDLALNHQTREQLMNKLLRMEHRTYLWLHLAIDDIAKTYRQSLRPGQVIIESLPTTIETAYEKILGRVSAKQQDTVKKILHIIVGARRPLTIEEMAIALGIATTTTSQPLEQTKLDPVWLEQRIRDWCGLFVFINHNRIYLIHQTAKEFLISSDHSTGSSSSWKHCLIPFEAEKEMAEICITYIGFEEMKYLAKSKLQQKVPNFITAKADEMFNMKNHLREFLRYASKHWPQHLRDADLSFNDHLTFRAYTLCDDVSGLFDIWFPIFWETATYLSYPQRSGSFHVLAQLGLDKVLLLMLQLQKNTAHIDALDSSGQTPLMRACQQNHKKVVQLLLDMGADDNLRCRYFNFITQTEGEINALLEAAEKNHFEVVELLVNNGAHINARGGLYGGVLQATAA